MAEPYHSCGKEVLRDGRHVADAASPELASALAIMLNKARFFACDISEDEYQKLSVLL